MAADGDGANSPFAAALARRMTEPGVDLGLMMRKVRGDVLRNTGSAQQPYWYESLPENPFYFVAAPAPAAGLASRLPTSYTKPNGFLSRAGQNWLETDNVQSISFHFKEVSRREGMTLVHDSGRDVYLRWPNAGGTVQYAQGTPQRWVDLYQIEPVTDDP